MKLKNNILKSWLAVSALLASGCELTSEPTLKPHIQQELNANTQNDTPVQAQDEPVPDGFEEELLASVGASVALPKEFEMTRFDVNANKVSINEFFAGLVADTPYSVAIHPEVSGEISLTLKDVTMDEVTKIVSRLYGIDVFREGKVVQVLPAIAGTTYVIIAYLQRIKAKQLAVGLVFQAHFIQVAVQQCLHACGPIRQIESKQFISEWLRIEGFIHRQGDQCAQQVIFFPLASSLLVYSVYQRCNEAFLVRIQHQDVICSAGVETNGDCGW